MPVSDPATHSAMMTEMILCRSAERPTSLIAPDHVCCPMPTCSAMPGYGFRASLLPMASASAGAVGGSASGP